MPRSVFSAIKCHHLSTGLDTVVFRRCHWQCIMGWKTRENRGRNGCIL